MDFLSWAVFADGWLLAWLAIALLIFQIWVSCIVWIVGEVYMWLMARLHGVSGGRSSPLGS